MSKTPPSDAELRERLSPLAFPIWAEFVQSRLTTQGWLERITEMARELEQAANP